jgi:DeoR family transcriptional regulator, deoxyribose operon repressor
MAEQTNGRLRQLADALSRGGVLRLREAAALLGVSEMTVRRDIAGARETFAYLGGHIVMRGTDNGYVMAREQGSHLAAKAAACAQAARLIEDDDTIFIDCGTTMPHLAERISPQLNVTVVCYALNVAVPLANRPNVRLILVGGLYNPASASFAVDDGLATLDRIGVNKAFISAGGVHSARGVTCSNFHEVVVKQRVMRRAIENHLVVDASKFGLVKPAYFAALDDFDSIITSPVPKEALSGFEGTSARIVIAED